MCTVIYRPLGDTVLLASNRDEQEKRLPALPPQVHTVNGVNMLFPQDMQAAGSWIAVQQNGGAAVLFNGAFVKHEPQYPYRTSRGIIFLELVSSDHFQQQYTDTDLTGIEPFTIVFFQDEQLWENRWDGQLKHSRSLDPSQTHFWSSSTLYSEEQQTIKAGLYRKWQDKDPFTAHQLLDFLSTEQLLTDRPGMLTVSSTCITLMPRTATMHYRDHRDQSQYHNSIRFSRQGEVQS